MYSAAMKVSQSQNSLQHACTDQDGAYLEVRGRHMLESLGLDYF